MSPESIFRKQPRHTTLQLFAAAAVMLAKLIHTSTLQISHARVTLPFIAGTGLTDFAWQIMMLFTCQVCPPTV